MTARSLAVLALTGAAVAGRAGVAAAQQPAPTPTPTPSPTPFPTPPPDVPADPNGRYVITVTNTTTTVNAPITWVAAPITTNVSNAGTGTPEGAPITTAPLELNLTGCGRRRSAKLSSGGKPVSQSAQVRIPASATLLLRVNGRRVGSVQLVGGHSRTGIPLRVRLGKRGRLTVSRPSGRILGVDACPT